MQRDELTDEREEDDHHTDSNLSTAGEAPSRWAAEVFLRIFQAPYPTDDQQFTAV